MRKSRLATAIAELAAQLSRPRYLRVVAEILVHDRTATGTRCPCCTSVTAEIVERIGAADLILDTRTGHRKTAQTETPETWLELCALAEVHRVPLRCSPKTLPLLLDDSGRHLFASGGNRAAKTTTGLYWLALQLLRAGGRERRFWLVAPTDEKAFRLLEKMFRPTPSQSGGIVPPILPGVLVERAPATHRASNLQTRLVDGSIVDLRSFHGDPSAERAKSDPIVAGLVDEAAHLPSAAWMSALRGRCVDLRGRLWLASTATVSSVIAPLVVEPALEFARLPADEPRKASGEHEGAAWVFQAMPMIDNPWLNLENIMRDMQTLDMNKPENRRDFLGEWVASEGKCWPNFISDPADPRCHVVAHEARTVGRLSPQVLAEHRAGGHVDITERVARALFGRKNPHIGMARASNFRWILGQDVNVSPMSTALLQITAPADATGLSPEARDTWHYWIVDTICTETSNSLRHAERLVSTELARTLDPDGKGSPLAGCGVIVDATAIGRDPTAHKHGQSGSVVETFWRAGLDARAPAYRPTTTGKPGHHNPEVLGRFTLMHRLINEGRLHVFARAGELTRAFDQQLVTQDGVVPIDSRRGKWDALMGPMDATSYAIYAVANVRAPAEARSW